MRPKKTIVYTVPDFYSEKLQLEILKSTEETIARVLKEVPEVDKIIHIITEHFKTPLSEILQKTNKKEVVYKRQILHYFLQHYSTLTPKHIGQISYPAYTSHDVLHGTKVIINTSYLKDVKNDLESITTKMKSIN